MAVNFSAKALGTFSGDGMMPLDRVVETTLLQNNGPTTNRSHISVSRISAETAGLAKEARGADGV